MGGGGTMGVFKPLPARLLAPAPAAAVSLCHRLAQLTDRASATMRTALLLLCAAAVLVAAQGPPTQYKATMNAANEASKRSVEGLQPLRSSRACLRRPLRSLFLCTRLRPSSFTLPAAHPPCRSRPPTPRRPAPSTCSARWCGPAAPPAKALGLQVARPGTERELPLGIASLRPAHLALRAAPNHCLQDVCTWTLDVMDVDQMTMAHIHQVRPPRQQRVPCQQPVQNSGPASSPFQLCILHTGSMCLPCAKELATGFTAGRA